jgi:hypothetical protein
MRSIGWVPHQHNRSRRIRQPKLAHELDRLAQSDTVANRPLGSTLDHGSVGHRIGKRHAELDDIRTRTRQSVQQRHGKRGFGVAGGDVGNQPLATRGPKFGKALRDSRHSATSAVPAKFHARFAARCATEEFQATGLGDDMEVLVTATRKIDQQNARASVGASLVA